MVSANAVSIDVSSTIASDSVVGTLNRGVVNLTPHHDLARGNHLVGLCSSHMGLVLLGHRSKGKSSQASATTQTSETALVDASRLKSGGSAFAVRRQIRGAKCIPLHSDAQCGLANAGRSVVASAPALGAGDREFESPRPDHLCRFDSRYKG